jgi:hypothetical protein
MPVIRLVSALAAAAALAIVAVIAVTAASAATQPPGYCSHGLRPTCVESTWQISTLTENSDSIWLNEGDTMTMTLCETYSNTAALGASFGAVAKFLALNASVTLPASYGCAPARSVEATKTGWWHWYGSAKRWESKVYEGLTCGAKFCVTNYSYPVAQDRWYWQLEQG